MEKHTNRITERLQWKSCDSKEHETIGATTQLILPPPDWEIIKLSPAQSCIAVKLKTVAALKDVLK